MIRTFDFVFQLKRSKKERDRIYSMMEAAQNTDCDLGGWHFLFEQDRKIVTITSNGTDEYLLYKIVPAEISCDSLKYIIDPEDKWEIECQINCF